MVLLWPRAYHNNAPRSRKQRFDTAQLTQNITNQKGYSEQITKEIEQTNLLTTPIGQKWETLKNIITSAAESHIGYKSKEGNKQITDPQIEKMSKEQRDIRLEIERCKDPHKIKELKKNRKRILKEISRKVKDAKEKEAEELIREIENA